MPNTAMNPMLMMAPAEAPQLQTTCTPDDVLRRARIAHSSRMATLAHVNRVVDERSTSRQHRKSLVRVQFDRSVTTCSAYDDHAYAYGEACGGGDGDTERKSSSNNNSSNTAGGNPSDMSQHGGDRTAAESTGHPNIADVSRASSRCSTAAAAAAEAPSNKPDNLIFSGGRISWCEIPAAVPATGPAVELLDVEDPHGSSGDNTARRNRRFGSGSDRGGDSHGHGKSVAFADLVAEVPVWGEEGNALAKSWDPESFNTLSFDIPTNVSEAWAEAAKAPHPGSALATLLASKSSPRRRSQRVSAPSGAILPSLRTAASGSATIGMEFGGCQGPAGGFRNTAGGGSGYTSSGGLIPATPQQTPRKMSWVGDTSRPPSGGGARGPPSAQPSASMLLTQPPAAVSQPAGTPLPSIATPPSAAFTPHPGTPGLAADPASTAYFNGGGGAVSSYGATGSWRAGTATPRDRERGRSPGASTPIAFTPAGGTAALSSMAVTCLSSSWSPGFTPRGSGGGASSGGGGGGLCSSATSTPRAPVLDEATTGTAARAGIAVAVGGARYRSPAPAARGAGGAMLRPCSRGNAMPSQLQGLPAAATGVATVSTCVSGGAVGAVGGAPHGAGGGGLQHKPPLPPPPQLQQQHPLQGRGSQVTTPPAHPERGNAGAGCHYSEHGAAASARCVGDGRTGCGNTVHFDVFAGCSGRQEGIGTDTTLQDYFANTPPASAPPPAAPTYAMPPSLPADMTECSETAAMACAGSVLSSLLHRRDGGGASRHHTPSRQRRQGSESSTPQHGPSTPNPYAAAGMGTGLATPGVGVAVLSGRSQKGIQPLSQQQSMHQPAGPGVSAGTLLSGKSQKGLQPLGCHAGGGMPPTPQQGPAGAVGNYGAPVAVGAGLGGGGSLTAGRSQKALQSYASCSSSQALFSRTR